MDKQDLLLEKLKLASELHRHQDDHVWQRFNHFLTLTSILISGFGLLQSSILQNSNPHIRLIASIGIAFYGLIISIIFSLIFKNSQVYQRYRIEQAKQAEGELKIDDKQIIDIYQYNIRQQQLVKVPLLARVSTYKLLFLMGILTTILWIFLLVFIMFWQ